MADFVKNWLYLHHGNFNIMQKIKYSHLEIRLRPFSISSPHGVEISRLKASVASVLI